jgi:hypothetical protein
MLCRLATLFIELHIRSRFTRPACGPARAACARVGRLVERRVCRVDR